MLQSDDQISITNGNEINIIESISQCFDKRYDDCPIFFMGSLRNACQTAFNSSKIQDRRPILVYIHHDQNIFSNIFCGKIFCSRQIIDYLLDNYIVWPWDITISSNKDFLIKIWKDLFSCEFLDDFSIDECPLLIGIMRLHEIKINQSIISEYQFKSLLKRDVITRTHKIVDRELLLDELHIFKREFDENEEILTFGFVKTFGLCWELILEIIKYLSLNDALTAFTPALIPLLNHNRQLKFQLSNSSISMMKMIYQKFQLEQIVSLQLNNGFRLYSTNELKFLSIFKQIICITFLNLSYENQIDQYKINFPNLTCFCLYYDIEINFHMFHKIFNQFWNEIKRLEIHTTGICCTHYDINPFDQFYMINYSIEYFVFDISHLSLNFMFNCFIDDQSCLSKTIFDFIKIMRNIQYVCLIINKEDIEIFLDVDKWIDLVIKCYQLKKIIITNFRKKFSRKQLINHALYIQRSLCAIRETIKFRIKFL